MNPGTFFIVGAAGGVGRALTARLVAAGGRVAAAGRNPEALAALAREHAGAVTTYPLDATDFAAVDAAVSAAAETAGGLAGAVNLAGSIVLKPAHLTSADDFARVVAANLTTAFALVRAAVKPMQRAGGGSIVLVSTVAAGVGLANHEAVAAAKAGVEGLARSAAATYAARGVRVNAVAPGLTRTPLAAPLIANPAMEKASTAMHPLGRLGEPGDIADAIAWLLSPQAAWVTGQVLAVDGGMRSVRPKPTV